MPTVPNTLTVHAGPHERHDCPIRFSLPKPLPEGDWELATDDGQSRPLQRLTGNEAAFIESHLPAETSRTYRFQPGQMVNGSPITLHEDADHALAIHQSDRLLTRYVYGGVKARPYFFPLHAPGDVPVTRGYPMLPDVPGEQRDHPHHRSLWIAFGEVNGADNWSEEPGHGYTLHQSIDLLESGHVAGRFATTSLWTDRAKKNLLTQFLTVTVWNTGENVRLLDFDIRLSATHGAAFFGDTKEGGILAVRVATVLDVPRTGRIENVYGGVNEAETWGRAAHWCDYSGIVDGKPVGIALLDHPLSFRYPTHWHVRDYGLMTANPFGYAAYTNGAKNGSHTLPAGETLPFRYRLVLHRGNATEGHVNARYLDFVSPPRVEVSLS